jgi:L-ascorbate metabolism protein UlaG (beta-lactamase superfamily)
MVASLLGCSAAVHRGPPGEHFDGRRFHNVPEVDQPGFGDLLRWIGNRSRGVWKSLQKPPGAPPPRRVSCPDMRVTFVGHSTLLIQPAGLNLLTDPIWSERASPVRHLGPRRHHPPGIRFEDLPPIDAVVVSHNHYDHLDVPTLRRLAHEHAPTIVVGLGNERLLRRKRIAGARALDWEGRVDLGNGVSIVGVQVQHWSLRGLADRDRALWLGYVIETPCGKVYFAGDTGFGPHFEQTARRHGPMRLALLPIGAYRPRWFMQSSHIDPAQAVAAHRLLGARTSVAMHYGTFALADEGEHEPRTELVRHLDPSERPRFWLLDHGEGRDVP